MLQTPVLKGLVVLLVCQFLGEVTVRLLGLEFPGPVVGMLFFLVLLRVRRPVEASALVVAPTLLLRHLHLLFVPAGVGIMLYLTLIVDHAWPLALGLWGSWLIGFVVTALVAAALLRTVKDRP